MMKTFYVTITVLLFGFPSIVWGQIEVKHFVFNEYQNAQILYKNKKVNQVSLNYNKATEEMVYIGSTGEKMALYPIDQIDTIYFGNRKFIPAKNAFDEVLVSGKYPLFATYRCRLSVGAQNIGYGSSSTTAIENISSLNTGGEMYQLQLPENYKAEPYMLYKVEIKGEKEPFKKVKDLAKIFPDLKKELEVFWKKNKIRNDKEGAIQTLLFIRSK